MENNQSGTAKKTPKIAVLSLSGGMDSTSLLLWLPYINGFTSSEHINRTVIVLSTSFMRLKI